MAKAFLSHSSRDKVLVEKIATKLGKNNCHYDKFTFEAGNITLDENIKGDLTNAISTLKESLRMNPNNYFAFRALTEIYKTKHMYEDVESLKRRYPNLVEDD